MRDGYIYVVQVGDLVKVGSGGGGRFHRVSSYALVGDELLSWTSPRHMGYIGAEREVIDRLTAMTKPRRGLEWFDVNFLDVVALARAAVAKHDLVAVAA